ncbi:hypothetical protein HY631_04320 [Candidatus Uhrbacteria bacterium]|nr:hypothetical protein [Candidatus Uhrbacteria bacterium]
MARVVAVTQLKFSDSGIQLTDQLRLLHEYASKAGSRCDKDGCPCKNVCFCSVVAVMGSYDAMVILHADSYQDILTTLSECLRLRSGIKVYDTNTQIGVDFSIPDNQKEAKCRFS